VKGISVAAGVALVALYIGVFIYTMRNLLGHIFMLPILIIGVFLIASGARTKSVLNLRKKTDQSIFEGVINIGEQKIKRGDLAIDKDKFINMMSRIKKYIVEQDEVPEYGFNSIYLKYKNEVEASDRSTTFKKMGINCETLQDRGKFYVMIEF
jgi:hypothetical protein